MKNFYAALITATENEYKAKMLANAAEMPTRYITALRCSQLADGKISKEKAVELASKKVSKDCDKSLADELAKLDALCKETRRVQYISIDIGWVKSSVWGMNPHCEAYLRYTDGTGETLTGTASGCGYDKESAAVAHALNQSLPLKAMLAEAKAKTGVANSHAALGYGFGYQPVPYLEGGVGVRCYWNVFEELGFKVHSHSSKHHDSYEVSL